MASPQDLLYASSHEWARIVSENGRKVATIGITDFALHQLTDLVFMELPKVGTHVTAGKEFGEVESVKAVSPLYSPVTGEVVAVNSELPNKLEQLGSDPYGQGWMLKVAISDEASMSSLLSAEKYDAQCASES